MDDPKQPETGTDAHPEVKGASRGTGDRTRDADRAKGDERAQPSTEYAANAEPGDSAAEGYVDDDGGEQAPGSD